LTPRYRLTPHAVEEAWRRGLDAPDIESVLTNPQQIVPASGGRKAYQSKFGLPDGRIMLVRAIVEEEHDGLVVVTVYRTTKIAKYWRGP